MNLIKTFKEKRWRVKHTTQSEPCCNHNPLDSNTTLQKSTKKLMVSPDKQFYICTQCQKSFVFNKDEKGELIIEKA